MWSAIYNGYLPKCSSFRPIRFTISRRKCLSQSEANDTYMRGTFYLVVRHLGRWVLRTTRRSFFKLDLRSQMKANEGCGSFVVVCKMHDVTIFKNVTPPTVLFRFQPDFMINMITMVGYTLLHFGWAARCDCFDVTSEVVEQIFNALQASLYHKIALACMYISVRLPKPHLQDHLAKWPAHICHRPTMVCYLYAQTQSTYIWPDLQIMSQFY